MPVFYSTGYAGFVGVLSGFKPQEFSMTIDTRFLPGGIEDMFYSVVAALIEKNASLVTFLARDVMQNENDFASAVENLSDDPLVADVYYIVAGTDVEELATANVLFAPRGKKSTLAVVVLPRHVFLIFSGTSAGQGAVISRNRTDAANVWMLDAPSRW